MPAWRRNLYILTVVQLLSTAGFSLVFPFMSLYVQEIGVATGGSVAFWAGLSFSSQAFTMMLAAPIWGAFADRHGRKVMLVRATFGGAVLLVLMGLVQNAEQLVVLRTIQGFVTGVVPAVNALVAASSPRERLGESLGLLNTARAAGVAVGPVIGGILGDAFGFRESFWITGTLLAISGLCALFWVTEEFVPPKRSAKRVGFFDSYKLLLKLPGVTGLYGLSFLRSLGQTMIFPMIALFVVELTGVTEGAASITGVIIGLASFTAAASGVWLGRLGDRIGHSKILVISALGATLFYVPQPFVTHVWQLVVLQALQGFAAGGLIPSTSSLMNLWAPAGYQGAIYGLDTSVNAGARSLAPMVAAAVAVWFGLRGVFGATALVYASSVLLGVVVLRRRQLRPAADVEAQAVGDD
jgi:DHA1 family multidrug resistance protein-like MFS transporter